ncbi:hypothetical protein VP01_1753g1 [Puccinia sorghi]|uniref:Uncharacterized protein n=1 Tax=Puccinia sorghi TaxID=27349 RepID=A0A0L6VFM9_9BASI|nr:hypothetical protein VP01_1753g1 [Puccinia sorghi]
MKIGILHVYSAGVDAKGRNSARWSYTIRRRHSHLVGLNRLPEQARYGQGGQDKERPKRKKLKIVKSSAEVQAPCRARQWTKAPDPESLDGSPAPNVMQLLSSSSSRPCAARQAKEGALNARLCASAVTNMAGEVSNLHFHLFVSPSRLRTIWHTHIRYDLSQHLPHILSLPGNPVWQIALLPSEGLEKVTPYVVRCISLSTPS